MRETLFSVAMISVASIGIYVKRHKINLFYIVIISMLMNIKREINDYDVIGRVKWIRGKGKSNVVSNGLSENVCLSFIVEFWALDVSNLCLITHKDAI